MIAQLLRSADPCQSLIALVLIASRPFDANGNETDAPGTTTLTDPDTGLALELTGTDLGADPVTDTFSGTVDSIVIKRGDGATLANVTLPTATSLRDMVDSARSISGPITPGNIGPFNDVIMPAGSPFPDLFLTDGDGVRRQ
jgi:hypothetical protein